MPAQPAQMQMEKTTAPAKNPETPAKPAAKSAPGAKTPAAPQRLLETTPAQSNMSYDGKPTDEEAIRYGAYLRWEAAGKPDGDGVCFWLESEKALAGQLAD